MGSLPKLVGEHDGPEPEVSNRLLTKFDPEGSVYCSQQWMSMRGANRLPRLRKPFNTYPNANSSLEKLSTSSPRLCRYMQTGFWQAMLRR